jgi:hypothetical protein
MVSLPAIPSWSNEFLLNGSHVGDIDVVALLDSWTVMLECKSSSHISANELALFLKRATLLQPAIAVLLIDAPTLSLDGHIRRLNALLARDGEEPLIPVASAEGIYWGAQHMCVTCVSQSLPSSLEAVLQVIEQNMSSLHLGIAPFFQKFPVTNLFLSQPFQARSVTIENERSSPEPL